MTITYTPVSIPKNVNTFEIFFYFEHGDADSYQTVPYHFDMTEEELVQFVKKAEEIYQMISDNRSGYRELPDNMEEIAKFGKHYIPIEYDNYAKMHMSNYYASTYIQQIFYYDKHGVKFEVTIT